MLDKVSPLRIAAAAAMVLAAIRLRSSSASAPRGPSVRLVDGVPLARGGAPTWPVLTKHPQRFEVGHVTLAGEKVGNQSRRFGASRDGRHHAGVDLYGYEGDVVVAAEPGVVTAVDPSWHLGAGALYLFTDSGLTLNYGEVASGSWAAFGIGPGSRVARGQKLARIGCMRHGDDGGCESHMLHFETYQGRRTTNIRWMSGAAAPAELRDPTAYLLRAAR